MIARLSKWEGIAYLIRAAGADDEQVARLAHLYIQRWSSRFNASFTSPTNTQVRRLSDVLATHGILLKQGILDQIKRGIAG